MQYGFEKNASFHWPSLLPVRSSSVFGDDYSLTRGLHGIREVSSFRSALGISDEEMAVFDGSLLSQPNYTHNQQWARKSRDLCTSEARFLPLAESKDVVLFSFRTDHDYLDWLRGFSMGPGRVVEYGIRSNMIALSEILKIRPQPVLEFADRLSKIPVLVPYYSGTGEIEAAKSIEARLFGSSNGSIPEWYFNKETFKEACRDLGIPVVAGSVHSISGGGKLQVVHSLENLVVNLLRSYPRLILRGTEGSGGRSVYVVDHSNQEKIYEEISRNRERRLLVEPFLARVSSPNDQWAISRDGVIHHLGTSVQIFEGLHYRGNASGNLLPQSTLARIEETSFKIVQAMKDDGYVGTMGIDYIVTDNGQLYPVENNARFTGSTFAQAIVDRLEAQIGPINHWKFLRALAPVRSFGELRTLLGDLIYSGTESNCVFPFDCDSLSINGKFTPLIIADNEAAIDYIERQLQAHNILFF